MYGVFKDVIESKIYSLEDMINKIDTKWIQGILTEEQRKELVALAQKNADPNLSNAPLQKQIEAIAKQHIALEETVTALSATVQKIKETVESGGAVVPEPEQTPQEEYPAWEPHNGIPPVKWQKNSKCTHNGKRWESMVDNNVWEPGAFGVGEEIWRLVA